MKTLRRFNIRPAQYFITGVTFRREPILLNNIDLFWRSWRLTKPKAWAILPDHFHAILEINEIGISEIMHSFKITYARIFRSLCGYGKVWQNRFWDHIIRDQNDFNRHLDYIHINPVKHGYAKSPADYEFSSFKEYVTMGYYEKSRGKYFKIDLSNDFGE